MDEYPSNSHSRPRKPAAQPDKREEPRVQRVVAGEVVRRKKPMGRRFRETFFGGDITSVWEGVVLELLVPAFKDMVADAASESFERMIFGEGRGPGRRTRGRRHHSSNGFTNYDRYGQNSGLMRRDEPRAQMSRRGRESHDFDEIILPSRAEASAVIDQLYDLVEKYETATVANLYQMVGISPNSVDVKWGWTDLYGAVPVRVRNGYLLDLPKPEYLD